MILLYPEMVTIDEAAKWQEEEGLEASKCHKGKHSENADQVGSMSVCIATSRK